VVLGLANQLKPAFVAIALPAEGIFDNLV